MRLIICILLIVFAGLSLSPTSRLIVSDPTGIKAQDFAYHYILAHRFWEKGKFNVYDFEDQEDTLSLYLGKSVGSAMPVGMTPTFLALFGLLDLLFGADIGAAYIGWIVVSVGLLVLALRQVPCSQSRLLMFGGLAVSPFFAAAIFLGQSSVICLGAFLLLISPSVKNKFAVLFCLFILSLKPYYFLLAVPLVIWRQGYRPVLYSMIAVGILWGIFTPRLEPNWLRDYMTGLLAYSTNSFPAHYSFWTQSFSSSVLSNSMPSLRTLSTVLYLSLTLSSIVLAIIYRKKNVPNVHLIFLLSILVPWFAMMIFGPQHGVYENILCIVPPLLIVAVLPHEETNEIMLTTLLLLLVGVVSLDRNFILFSKSVFWLILTAILGCKFRQNQRPILNY